MPRRKNNPRPKRANVGKVNRELHHIATGLPEISRRSLPLVPSMNESRFQQGKFRLILEVDNSTSVPTWTYGPLPHNANKLTLGSQAQYKANCTTNGFNIGLPAKNIISSALWSSYLNRSDDFLLRKHGSISVKAIRVTIPPDDSESGSTEVENVALAYTDTARHPGRSSAITPNRKEFASVKISIPQPTWFRISDIVTVQMPEPRIQVTFNSPLAAIKPAEPIVVAYIDVSYAISYSWTPTTVTNIIEATPSTMDYC